MADTLVLSLGTATANGKDAATQCLFFKTLMRIEIGRDPDGAWMKMVGRDNTKMEMQVEYDPDVPGALGWAKNAQERADRVWEQVAGRQRPHENIVARSRGD